MIAIISAPTNLGLRTPEPGAVPGTAKAPEALREAGLFGELDALDAGVVLPGRYVDDDGRRPDGMVRNQAAIVDHSRRLAERIVHVVSEGHAPLVIGGDCSVLVGVGLASRVLRRDGLVHVDGHTDFRHPGNSVFVGAVAGEDLAVAVGRHIPELADIDGLGPYFSADATVHVGCRLNDEHLEEADRELALVLPAADVILHGGARAALRVRQTLGAEQEFWLQIDVDVLDPAVMPAVDSPDEGGIEGEELTAVLSELAPRAWGASVTVYDPDLDPDGTHAATLVDLIAAALGNLGTARGD